MQLNEYVVNASKLRATMILWNLRITAPCRGALHACYPTAHPMSTSSGRVTPDAPGDTRQTPEVRQAYGVLGLPTDCVDLNVVRSAFVDLAKRLHPDVQTNSKSPVSSAAGSGLGPGSGHLPDGTGQTPDKSSSSSESFVEVRRAYETLTAYISCRQGGAGSGEAGAEAGEAAEEVDLRHSAPQHRQFLEYGGFGYGTPSQRQRQYQKHRFQQGVEAVNEYRTQKHLATEGTIIEKDKARDIHLTRQFRMSNALERVVEDLIQESMMRGEFTNLPGKGKPLDTLGASDYNPYVNRMTHRLNKLLVENGFAPEWISLEKEIRERMRSLRAHLRTIARHTLASLDLPSSELSSPAGRRASPSAAAGDPSLVSTLARSASTAGMSTSAAGSSDSVAKTSESDEPTSVSDVEVLVSPEGTSPSFVGTRASTAETLGFTERSLGSNARTSASNAGTSGSPAGTSPSAAERSASLARRSTSTKRTSASTAGTSVYPAESSVSPAGTSASAAGTSASAVGTSASAAVTSASAVGTSAYAAGTSASAVGTSASAVGTSASAAGTSASAVGTSASAAGTSASAVGTPVSDLGTPTSTAGTSASTAWSVDTVQYEQGRAAAEVADLNDLIHKFNLIVPTMHRQLIPLDFRREMQKASKDIEGVLREKQRANQIRTSQHKPEVLRKSQSRWEKILSFFMMRF